MTMSERNWCRIYNSIREGMQQTNCPNWLRNRQMLTLQRTKIYRIIISNEKNGGILDALQVGGSRQRTLDAGFLLGAGHSLQLLWEISEAEASFLHKT